MAALGTRTVLAGCVLLLVVGVIHASPPKNSPPDKPPTHTLTFNKKARQRLKGAFKAVHFTGMLKKWKEALEKRKEDGDTFLNVALDATKCGPGEILIDGECIDRDDCTVARCKLGQVCVDNPAPLDGYTCKDTITKPAEKVSSSHRKIYKKDKIIIVGGGPGGLSTAIELWRAGARDITILEKTGRIGGKSLTRKEVIKGTTYPVEMGTCFAHLKYDFVFDYLNMLDMEAPVVPEGRALFSKTVFGDDKPRELKEFIQETIMKRERVKHPKATGITGFIGKVVSKVLTGKELVKSIWRYDKLHKKMFGDDYSYTIPPRLTKKQMKAINMTMQEWLQKHELDAMIPFLQVAQTAQGYGLLETIPAYYGLMWISPGLMWGFLRQSIGLAKVTTMMKHGYQSIWDTAVKKYPGIKILKNVQVLKIVRGAAAIPVEITYKHGGATTTKKADSLIMAINMKYGVKLFTDPSPQETKIFGKLKTYRLTTTLYKSPPITGYTDKTSNKAIMYYADVLKKGFNDAYYADRNDAHIYTPKREWGTQQRVGYQFYADYLDDQEILAVPPFKKNKQLVAKLKKGLEEKGVAKKDVQIIEQYAWPYFPHFELNDISHIWDIQDMQGLHNVFYVGASVSFESVNDVIAYSKWLKDRFYDGGVRPPRPKKEHTEKPRLNQNLVA